MDPLGEYCLGSRYIKVTHFYRRTNSFVSDRIVILSYPEGDTRQFHQKPVIIWKYRVFHLSPNRHYQQLRSRHHLQRQELVTFILDIEYQGYFRGLSSYLPGLFESNPIGQ